MERVRNNLDDPLRALGIEEDLMKNLTDDLEMIATATEVEPDEEGVSDDVTKPSLNDPIDAVFLFQNYRFLSTDLLKALKDINLVIDINSQGTKRQSIVSALKIFFNKTVIVIIVKYINVS